MKLLWFHLAPYPELPDDFRDRHRSVWVDIDSGLFDPEVGAEALNLYLDQLEHADACGFDGICVNEHHQQRLRPHAVAEPDGRRPHPQHHRRGHRRAWATRSRSTTRPSRVAEEFAMLDCMSGGRLVAGLPSRHADGHDVRLRPEPGHVARALPRGARPHPAGVDEPEPFAFNGEFTQLRYVNIWPRPMQQPHPPVWIPGGGSVETWEWYAPSWTTCTATCRTSGTSARPATRWRGSGERIERLGYDDNPYRAGFLQFVGRGRHRRRGACASTASAAEYFYHRCLHVYARLRRPAGLPRRRPRSRSPGRLGVRRGRRAGPRRRPAVVGRHGRDGLRHHRLPGHRARAARPRRPRPAASVT